MWTRDGRRRAAAHHAADDPDLSRPERVFEAVLALQEAYAYEEALELLGEWPAWPDETHRGFAQVGAAGLLRLLERDDEADRAVQALRASRPGPAVCTMAAEVEETAGDLREALRWFDLGLAGLEPGSPDEHLLLLGRRRVRSDLGLPPDASDLRVDPPLPAEEREARLQAALAAQRPPPAATRPGRNDPCPCGSGQKHKRCCLRA